MKQGSTWYNEHSGGWVAELLGLLDRGTGRRERIYLGTYGTRAAAVLAITGGR